MGTLIVLVIIGIGIGVWLVKRGAAKATASGVLHDSITTPDNADTRAVIDRWAQAHGYEQVQGPDGALRYQKHVGAKAGNPTYLDVRAAEGVLTLESYVGVLNPFTRKSQGQMPLSAPGMVLAIPRKTAAREHNLLRSELGLPAIG